MAISTQIKLLTYEFIYVILKHMEYFRIKIRGFYICWDLMKDFALHLNVQKSFIFHTAHLQDPKLMGFIKQRTYDMEEVVIEDNSYLLSLYRGDNNTNYLIEFPPFDDFLGKHYLGYSKDKGFYITTKHVASVFAIPYLIDDELKKYLCDKEFKLLSIEKSEFHQHHFSGVQK